MSIKVGDFGGKMTPDQLLLKCMEKSSTAKIVCVVMLGADNHIMTGASDGSCLKKLGMLELFRDRLIKSMDE